MYVGIPIKIISRFLRVYAVLMGKIIQNFTHKKHTSLGELLNMQF